jgi:cobalt-zinc-cadmium efflux system protein
MHAHSHHAHDHHHDHHHHSLSAARPSAALAFGIALNFAFVVIEAGFGFFAGSIALLADASHNLGDVLALAASWAAMLLAGRRPSRRYTYGLRSSSILVALFNAIILLIAVGGIMVEAAQRLASSAPVAGGTVIVVALIGVVVNGGTALMIGSGHGDLNMRGAFVHMAADAAVSVGVALSGAIILFTGWHWLDPAASLAIAAVIVLTTWRLLRQALDMALHAVPPGIDAAAVQAHLAHIAGVEAVHDLHIWPMSTTETALTAHLVMPTGHPGDAALARIANDLHDRFAIGHVTLQVETDLEGACRLTDHAV